MSDHVNYDTNRKYFTGIDEIIYAEGKTTKDLILAIDAALLSQDQVLVSRVQQMQLAEISRYEIVAADDFQRTFILGKQKNQKLSEHKVAIISGGTSDLQVVQEIAIALQYLGVKSEQFLDVGVAGLHRLLNAAATIRAESQFYCVIAVAGFEGALFPVIAGQLKLPVIAVPAPVGYGYQEKGYAALSSALNSCAPGIATMNIGNGIGAAILAKKMRSTFTND